MLTVIPKMNPYAARGLDEDDGLDSKLAMKDAQMQHQKDMLRIERDRNQSLSNQLKTAK